MRSAPPAPYLHLTPTHRRRCDRVFVLLLQQERLIYVPMWVKDKYRVISRSLASLREALGREPTSKELADQVLVDTDSKVGEGGACVRVVFFGLRRPTPMAVNLQ